MYPIQFFNTVPRGFRFKDIYPASFGALAGKPHLGVDLIVEEGTPIYAPFDGRVEEHPASECSECGNMIYFFYEDYIMRFMHLSRFAGSGAVTQGEVIGYSGNTGVSSGPHIHLDTSLNHIDITNINNFVDPEVFPWEGEHMDQRTQDALDLYAAIEANRIEAYRVGDNPNVFYVFRVPTADLYTRVLGGNFDDVKSVSADRPSKLQAEIDQNTDHEKLEQIKAILN